MSIVKIGGDIQKVLKSGNTEDLMLYEDGGAVEVKDTRLSDYLKNETGEKLLLAFPDTGQHENECKAFLDFIRR